MAMEWWTVTLNGEEIDEVPYVAGMTANEVKRSLIEHDDYDPLIEVSNGEESSDDDVPPDESMDGDHESGLASAGFGTDENYGGWGEVDTGCDD